jgi:hypothetical protein
MTWHEDWADYLDPGAADPGLPHAQSAALNRLAGRLATSALWEGPPPQLRQAVLDGDRPQDRRSEGRDVLVAARLRFARIRRALGSWWIPVAVLVVLAALVAVAVLWPRADVTSVRLSGTAIAPGAAAVARLGTRPAGLAIRLQVRGLTSAGAGEYYAAWVRGPQGVVPVGTFHWRRGDGPVDLWSGVEAGRYPELFVTVQQEGGPATPSEQVVLTGRISRP